MILKCIVNDTFQVSYFNIYPKIKRVFLNKTDKRIDSKDSISLIDSQLNFAKYILNKVLK